MKEKVLEIIKTTDLDDLNFNKNFLNVLQSQALSKIIIKDNKAIFAIDIGILEINKRDADILAARYQEEIEKNTDLKVSIILTDNHKRLSADQSSPRVIKSQQNQGSEQKPFYPEKIAGVNNVIVVASGKGGVGKSTVAVNLALSLKRIGFKVAIVDADIYGPSISHLMNLVGKPKIEDNLMIPLNSYGVECISVGSLIDGSAAGIWRGPMISKILYQLIRGTRWHDKNDPSKINIDYMIIDFPPGTGDVQLSMIQKFPISGAIIVSTPSDLAVIDVIKSIDMFRKLNIPILGVIQNMSYLLDRDGNKNYLFGKDQAKKMAEELKLNFLGDVPLNFRIRESGDQKAPIVVTEPSSEISVLYGQIAENIIDVIPNN